MGICFNTKFLISYLMTKSVQKISLLAIIPIIAIAMIFVPLTDVHAQKICGDRLCISGDVEDERKKM